MTVLFLTEFQVLRIHDDMIATYGGLAGVRDLAALQSAIAQPYAGFGGAFLHKSIFDKAGAYLYHISRNHPFLDGNKRTATESAFAFLELNGYTRNSPEDEVIEFVVDVAQGFVDKATIAIFLKSHCEAIS